MASTFHHIEETQVLQIGKHLPKYVISVLEVQITTIKLLKSANNFVVFVGGKKKDLQRTA